MPEYPEFKIDSEKNPFIDWDKWEADNKKPEAWGAHRGPNQWHTEEPAWARCVQKLQDKVKLFQYYVDNSPPDAIPIYKEELEMWKRRLAIARYN